ncbi:AraC family transcriptional regulator [Paenibacillus harenae]|uniref:AraC family transcriptional regulator n=1 Tax=Paenibacillus harenae TaxID=306543 RepID=UPI000409776B|nr:helix-turn-helix domain-containing protein [Paenibacillus harenae]
MAWPKRWLKRRSVILTWLFSYLGILLIPIVISVVVSQQSQKMLESEIHRANDALLEQVRQVIDNEFDNIMRLTTELMWNPRIRAFMYSNYYQNSEFLYDLYMTAKDLGLYQTLYPFIKNYYVYWKKGDVVLLPGVYRDSKLAHSDIHGNDRISYDLWMDLLNSHYEKRFLKIQGKMADESTLAYIHSFQGDPLAEPPGTAVVLLDTVKLLDVIRNLTEFSGGEVMILDEMNRVLLSSSGAHTDSMLLSKRFGGNKGTFLDEFRGEESEFFYIKSKHANITYVTVVPSRLYWEKARYVNNMTYAALLISLACGVLLTIYLLRKNYNPVSRIMRVLNNQMKGASHNDDNEFSYIHAAISNVLSEKEQAQYKMKQQTNMLRSNMLGRLLKGQGRHQLPLEDSLAAFHIDFKSDQFAVMLFYVQDYEAFFKHVQGENSSDKLKLMHFIMINIVEEHINHKHRGVMAEVEDCMACLINLDPMDEAAAKNELLQLAKQTRAFMLDKFRIDATISISGVKQSEHAIADAYKEALDGMEYQFIVGERDIISYDDLLPSELDSEQSSYYYPIQTEQQLMNYVRAGDDEKAETIVREIIERNVTHPMVSVGLVKCLMFNLIGTLINTLNEIGDMQDSVVMDTSGKIDELLACENIRDMEQRFIEILKEVCEYTAFKRKQQQQTARGAVLQERSAEIIAYIEKNYTDANLNITMIGEHFGMTQTYLSKLFKEQTGDGILNTINQVRMEHAKALLKDGSNSIKSVAGSVGFHDVNTFIRTFKKVEGITPGQYQKMV